MAETKYGKYVLGKPPQGHLRDLIVRIDNDTVEGSQHFIAHRISPWYVPEAHAPHIHRDPEILVMLGTNPDDPWDLGAEVEICMGPEMEKHVITTSSLVYIPAKFIHCPIRYRNVRRPFIFIQDQYSPKMTEFPCKGLIPEEERAKMAHFHVDGTQTREEVERQMERNA